jgi:hypothetical protein
MALIKTNRLLAYRNDATDQLHLTFSVTTTSVINTTFTENHTFARAFLDSAATLPKVIGANVRKAGAGAAAVIANATSMSVYLRGLSPTAYTDQTVLVEVTLEGGY